MSGNLVAAAKRAQAVAKRAEADALDAEAAALEQSADDPVPIEDAAAKYHVRVRVLQDAGRRGDLVIERAGRRQLVRPSEAARWARTRRPGVVRARPQEARADERIADPGIAAAAARLRLGA